MRRAAIGILTLVLLAVGLYVQWAYPNDHVYIALASLRMAAVTAAVWLAYPQLAGSSPWPVALVLAGALMVAWRPKLIWLILPVLVALWLLRPRGKR